MRTLLTGLLPPQTNNRRRQTSSPPLPQIGTVILRQTQRFHLRDQRDRLQRGEPQYHHRGQRGEQSVSPLQRQVQENCVEEGH